MPKIDSEEGAFAVLGFDGFIYLSRPGKQPVRIIDYRKKPVDSNNIGVTFDIKMAMLKNSIGVTGEEK